jgi:hypothetical protein
MSENTKSILGFRKKTLEAELLAIAPDLMRDYLETCVALSAVERSGARYEVHTMEFTACRTPIEAMEAYLDKVKEFTDPEIIITALLDGGFAPNDKRRRYNIKDSIRYHTERSNRLIIQEDKLGKPEWPPRIDNQLANTPTDQQNPRVTIES